MGRLKTVIHLHSDYSFDSNSSPRSILKAARREGVDCVALTDHDEIAGAIALQALGGVRVIIGEEISSAAGHIIGLFLHERVSPGMSATDTLNAIHDQGGVALAPHPFCTLCEGSLGENLESLADRLDAIEVHNAQNLLPWQDRQAADFATQHEVTGYVGSDGHIRGRIAPAFQIMEDFSSPEEFLMSLRSARLIRGRFGPLYFLQMGARHFWDKLAPMHLPGYGVNSADTRRATRNPDSALTCAPSNRAAVNSPDCR